MPLNSPIISRVCILSPVVFLVYIIGLCIYRLKFHPFAKYPGPWLARVSSIYGLWHAWQRDLHLNQLYCHEAYGNVVRYTPDRLIVNTSDALHDIYGPAKNFYKGRHYWRSPLYPNTFSTHNVLDKKIHGRKRRILGHGFSDASLRAAEPTILQHVDELCTLLLKDTNKPGSAAIDTRELTVPSSSASAVYTSSGTWSTTRDMTVLDSYTTFDIVSDLAFGRSFNMLHDTSVRFVRFALDRFAWGQQLAGQWPELFAKHPDAWWNLRRWLITGYFRERSRFESLGRSRAVDMLNDFKRKNVDGNGAAATDNAGSNVKRSSPPDKHTAKTKENIMSFVIAATDPETGDSFTDREIMAESNLLIGAGADTTSTAVSALFFYLSQPQNKHSYEELATEIRNTFPTYTSIRQGPLLSSCIYLRACIDETMRMSPSIPSALYREAGAGGAWVTVESIEAQPLPTKTASLAAAKRTKPRHHSDQERKCFIPEGMEIGVSSYCIHHNETYFPDPYSFDPSRWITSTPPSSSVSAAGKRTTETPPRTEKAAEAEILRAQPLYTQRRAFCPFSVGPRMCIARGLAYLEISLIIARVLWSMDFETAEEAEEGSKASSFSRRKRATGEGVKGEFHLNDQFITTTQGPLLKFRKRASL